MRFEKREVSLIEWNTRRDWQIKWILPQFILSDLILSCEKNSFFVRFEKRNYVEIHKEIEEKIPINYLILSYDINQTSSHLKNFPNIILAWEIPKPIEMNFRSFEKNWQFKINERSQRTRNRHTFPPQTALFCEIIFLIMAEAKRTKYLTFIFP